jgi:streptomycin 6-kinase
VTGHHERLHQYLRRWQLSNPELLATTATSYVYKAQREQETLVLKLLNDIGIKDEQRGAAALRFFSRYGAVRLIEATDDAHLLGYIDGPALSTLSHSGQDEGATIIIAELLNKLHSPRPATIPASLTPLHRWFRSLFHRAMLDKQRSAETVFSRGAAVAENLLTTAQDVCVLHGDVHHDNIKHSSEYGWLAFDPKGLVGERTFDVANTLCNPFDLPELVLNEARLLRNAEILSDRMGLEIQRVLNFTFAYACLSASWTHDAGGDAALALGVAAIVEPYVR